MQRAMAHAFAQHVNHPALANLTFETGQELEQGDVRFVRVIGNAELPQFLRLRRFEEGEKVSGIQRVGAVVISRPSCQPTRAARRRGRNLLHRVGDRLKTRSPCHRLKDERLKTLLAGVGGHIATSNERLPLKILS